MTVLQTILLQLAIMWGGAYLSAYYATTFTKKMKRKRPRFPNPKKWNWSISFSGFGVKV